jgi:glutamate-1-semialdehyde 2,1-aminomutase
MDPFDASRRPVSAAWFARGDRVIPGGVNSPVRSFRAVGGTPVLAASGRGSRIRTADGVELTDYCGSWGPLILGHAHPEVVAAVGAAAADGLTFGLHTRAEVEFAELICALVPSIEKVRLVSSGTEAVMTALRLARGVTGRRRLLKFDGCYHGHTDAMLVAAGSGLLTGGISSSAGVPPSVAEDVFVVPYNDLNAVRAVVATYGAELAGLIVEPIAGNMGLVPPAPGFLAGLRAAADRCGAVLIFDEVITGFRLGPTTYGELCGVRPDLTTLGKIMGGGLPIGAVGGRAAVMDALAPTGRVYQAGTLSGNPVAVAAGRATLEILRRDNPYPELERLGRCLEEGLRAAIAQRDAAVEVARIGSLFTLFFRRGPVRNMADARACDTAAFAAFFHAMLERSIYLPPAQFETAFLSTAHTPQQIEEFVAAATASLAAP